MTKVFIDGKAGTTGLKIYDRLKNRKDVELLTLNDEERKDISARKKMLNSCDVAFLCLPDDASRESVSLIDNQDVIVIDTSTAHRTNPSWAYGFPELSKKFQSKIKNSKRIAVPGCHASGFIALIYPLINEKIISKKSLLTCFSITGFSGGGKKMIAEYEDTLNSIYASPRVYGLSQNHKHLKEMVAITGLENAPIFSPVVSNFYSGMLVNVPLFKSMLKKNKTINDVKAVYKKYYKGDFVKFIDDMDQNGFIESNTLSNFDGMQIAVYGNEDRITLFARYDNLGKGASGAAIECFNVVTKKDKKKGLNI